MESDSDSEDTETLIPRNYQVELMKVALRQNTIIYLPTGSGKTFIAIMVLKHMSGSLENPYNCGGKITLILVNSIALVAQHAKYIKDHTVFTVGCYTGEMKVDFWTREQWVGEFCKYQVIIMTSQILVNILSNNFIDLNRVNLMIFDECHRGVDDHSMRQVMRKFEGVQDPPRVLGLTATLLNRNCKIDRVMEEVRMLEVTYHSNVATVDGLQQVIGFSTNPRELFKYCADPFVTPLQRKAIACLSDVILILSFIDISEDRKNPPMVIGNLQPLENGDIFKRLKCLISDLIFHIEHLGTFGGFIACIAHSIQIERIKKHCQDIAMFTILNYVLTVFGCVKGILSKPLSSIKDSTQIRALSSDKVNALFDILEEFKTISQEELCALIFVERRFTAKVLHHIITKYKQANPVLEHVTSNFIVGYNNNPYNETRESLYINKKNSEVINGFINKEFNVLFSSNVLEEGVDIPKCTLVVKFDQFKDYRSYIQSKGRARHKSSIYYTIVENSGKNKFLENLAEFQRIETLLNDFLVGKTSQRPQPKQHEINRLYNEDLIRPYYVGGPGSASVDMLGAISLLCRYCSCLSTNKFASYAPEWYLEEDGPKRVRVVIILPIICPIVQPIQGPFMPNKKFAKRAAAMYSCIALHKIGELNDALLPNKIEEILEDVSFLFNHWPEIKDRSAGNKKKKRLHDKQIAPCLKGPLLSPANTVFYLHLIVLNPLYYRSDDYSNAIIYDLYKSSSTFGLLSLGPLPKICTFPVYDSNGTVEVSIQVIRQIVLSPSDISKLREFHYLIFNDVLEVLQPFLILDNDGSNTEMLLLTPVLVEDNDVTVDFKMVDEHKTIENKHQELSLKKKLNLNVTEETYLHKIVTPWYRNDSQTFIVTQVLTDKTPRCAFPNNNYRDFVGYYADNYNITITNMNQPLLLVKMLSTRLNMYKPRGREGKRKRERRFDDSDVQLIPELVVKQDFPPCLYIQARFLPTILSRLTYLLRLESFQRTIANDLRLDVNYLINCPELEIDKHLLTYVPYELNKPKSQDNVLTSNSNVEVMAIEASPSLWTQSYNKDFASKILEAEYPWKNIDEPKDIDRELSVNTIDIEHYEVFISQRVKAGNMKKNDSPYKDQILPALTYPKEFEEKDLMILSIKYENQSPNLCEIYRALTAAEANDIVNLERLETLGDSYLKLISSLFIFLKYPKYNEGSCTTLKGKLVSNKNLYYLALKKNLGGLLKNCDFSPKNEWMPPGFCVPPLIAGNINAQKWSINTLCYLNIPPEEQISGELSQSTIEDICNEDNTNLDDDEDSAYSTKCNFLNKQYVGDKTVSDCVEALLGAYFQSGGMIGGVKFIEWIGLIPKSENLERVLSDPPPDPILDPDATSVNIDFHLPQWKEFEKRFGYHFQNRGYLLQALTHSSYTPNRITQSYERLEFVGDAILDFLITCYIFEHCGYLDPGQVTDLRSALVNNNTFASLLVRSGFHKFILLMSSTLQGYIDKFAAYLETKDYIIDDEVLILLEEEDLNLAEYVDVPKVLGDVFEALAGAVYLDSGKDLATVWNVFHRIMWREMEMFSENVPINIIRKLYECPSAYPVYSKPFETDSKNTMVSLKFMCEGQKKLVHGFGSNKAAAKRAAAKIALRSLKM